MLRMILMHYDCSLEVARRFQQLAVFLWQGLEQEAPVQELVQLVRVGHTPELTLSLVSQQEWGIDLVPSLNNRKNVTRYQYFK